MCYSGSVSYICVAVAIVPNRNSIRKLYSGSHVPRIQIHCGKEGRVRQPRSWQWEHRVHTHCTSGSKNDHDTTSNQSPPSRMSLKCSIASQNSASTIQAFEHVGTLCASTGSISSGATADENTLWIHASYRFLSHLQSLHVCLLKDETRDREAAY